MQCPKAGAGKQSCGFPPCLGKLSDKEGSHAGQVPSQDSGDFPFVLPSTLLLKGVGPPTQWSVMWSFTSRHQRGTIHSFTHLFSHPHTPNYRYLEYQNQRQGANGGCWGRGSGRWAVSVYWAQSLFYEVIRVMEMTVVMAAQHYEHM